MALAAVRAGNNRRRAATTASPALAKRVEDDWRMELLRLQTGAYAARDDALSADLYSLLYVPDDWVVHPAQIIPQDPPAPAAPLSKAQELADELESIPKLVNFADPPRPRPPPEEWDCWTRFRIFVRYRIVMHWLFDAFILLSIIINCVFLAIAKPTLDSGDPIMQVASVAELVFLVIFTLEMVLKMIAFGFLRRTLDHKRRAWIDTHKSILEESGVRLPKPNYAPASPQSPSVEEKPSKEESKSRSRDDKRRGSLSLAQIEVTPEEEVPEQRLYPDLPGYFRDTWNWLDFFIVVISFMSLLPSVGNFSSLRIIRALRPLKTLNKFKGLRLLVTVFLNSMRKLADVGLIIVFIFVVYGIIGVQLFAGKLRFRCFHVNDTGLLRPGVVCSTGAGLVDECGAGLVCRDSGVNPNQGTTNFDHIGWAALTLLTCITHDGWDSVMYMVQNAVSGWAWLYFVSWIFLGSLFAMNLVLAVITDTFASESSEADGENAEKAATKRKKAREARRKKRREKWDREMSRSRRRLSVARSQSGSFIEAPGGQYVADPTGEYLHRVEGRRSSLSFHQAVTAARRNSLEASGRSSAPKSSAQAPHPVFSDHRDDAMEPVQPIVTRISASRLPKAGHVDPDHVSTHPLAGGGLGVHVSAAVGHFTPISRAPHAGASDMLEADGDLLIPSAGAITADDQNEFGTTHIGTAHPGFSSPDQKLQGEIDIFVTPRGERGEETASDSEEGLIGGVGTNLSSEQPSAEPHGETHGAATPPPHPPSVSSVSDSPSLPIPGDLSNIRGEPVEDDLRWTEESFGRTGGDLDNAIELANLTQSGDEPGEAEVISNSKYLFLHPEDLMDEVGTVSRLVLAERMYLRQVLARFKASLVRREKERVASQRCMQDLLVRAQSRRSGISRSVTNLHAGAALQPAPAKHSKTPPADTFRRQEPQMSRMKSVIDLDNTAPVLRATRDLTERGVLVAQKQVDALSRMPVNRRKASTFMGLDSLRKVSSGAGDAGGTAVAAPGSPPSARSSLGSVDRFASEEYSSVVQPVGSAGPSATLEALETVEEVIERLKTPVDSVDLEVGFYTEHELKTDSADTWLKDEDLVTDVENMIELELKLERQFRLKVFYLKGKPQWIWRVNDLVYNAWFTHLITCAIVLNSLFMAMEHHNMDEDFSSVLFYANEVFTYIFTVEMIIKLVGIGPSAYVHDPWNLFDGLIVLISLAEKLPFFSAGGGISVLRTFRLLRVFKLFKGIRDLRRLLSTVMESVSAVGYMTVLILLFMFMFAVFGLQMMADKYPEGSRWHFNDFYFSCITIFQVMTGDNWTSVMYDSVPATGNNYILIFFVILLLLGKYVVVNLFIAILLEGFSGQSEEKFIYEDIATFAQQFKEAAASLNDPPWSVYVADRNQERRFKKLYVDSGAQMFSEQYQPAVAANWSHQQIKHMFFTPMNGFDAVLQVHDSVPPFARVHSSSDLLDRLRRQSTFSGLGTASVSQNEDVGDRKTPRGSPSTDDKQVQTSDDAEAEGDLLSPPRLQSREAWSHFGPFSRAMLVKFMVQELYVHRALLQWHNDLRKRQVVIDQELSKIPHMKQYRKPFGTACNCLRADNRFRVWLFGVVDASWFEVLITALILANCVMLAIDNPDVESDSTLGQVLFYSDIVFTAVFALEMVMKMLALGVWKPFNAYLRDPWNVLDGIVVLGSFLSLGFPSASWVRAVRSLRPIRIILRSDKIRVVVISLLKSVPSLAAVVVFCSLFWFIFGVMGINLFKGQFFRCNDDSVDGRAGCVGSYRREIEGPLGYNNTHPGSFVQETVARDWSNRFYNFDHVGAAFLALFQAASGNAWTDVMYDTMDARGVDKQPREEASPAAALFLIVFFIVCSFFTLNLFIGSILDNFNRLKSQLLGSAFATPKQRRWQNLNRIMRNNRLRPYPDPPQNRLRLWCFWLVSDDPRYPYGYGPAFDIGVMLAILLNTLVMCMRHHEMSEGFVDFLYAANLLFTVLFALEAAIKILAFGPKLYWFEPWNRFDLILVFLSFASFFLDVGVGVSVVRVFRLARIFRIVKRAKQLQALFDTLILSLPALWNLGSLLFVFFFTYAVIGVTFFGEVAESDGGLDRNINFRTWGNAMGTLFRVATVDAWGPVIRGICIDESNSDCGQPGKGKCGLPFAWLYVVSFMVIGSYVFINLFVAVILDNFSERAQRPMDIEQAADGVSHYTVLWNRRFDPLASGRIAPRDFVKLLWLVPQPYGLAPINVLDPTANDSLQQLHRDATILDANGTPEGAAGTAIRGPLGIVFGATLVTSYTGSNAATLRLMRLKHYDIPLFMTDSVVVTVRYLPDEHSGEASTDAKLVDDDVKMGSFAPSTGLDGDAVASQDAKRKTRRVPYIAPTAPDGSRYSYMTLTSWHLEFLDTMKVLVQANHDIDVGVVKGWSELEKVGYFSQTVEWADVGNMERQRRNSLAMDRALELQKPNLKKKRSASPGSETSRASESDSQHSAHSPLLPTQEVAVDLNFTRKRRGERRCFPQEGSEAFRKWCGGKELVLVSSHEHQVARWFHHLGTFFCDVCQGGVRSPVSYHCPACRYNVCEQCLPVVRQRTVREWLAVQVMEKVLFSRRRLCGRVIQPIDDPKMPPHTVPGITVRDSDEKEPLQRSAQVRADGKVESRFTVDQIRQVSRRHEGVVVFAAPTAAQERETRLRARSKRVSADFTTGQPSNDNNNAGSGSGGGGGGGGGGGESGDGEAGAGVRGPNVRHRATVAIPRHNPQPRHCPTEAGSTTLSEGELLRL